MGKEQFLGVYITAGVLSSMSSYFHKAVLKQSALSLGAVSFTHTGLTSTVLCFFQSAGLLGVTSEWGCTLYQKMVVMQMSTSANPSFRSVCTVFIYVFVSGYKMVALF